MLGEIKIFLKSKFNEYEFTRQKRIKEGVLIDANLAVPWQQGPYTTVCGVLKMVL